MIVTRSAFVFTKVERIFLFYILFLELDAAMLIATNISKLNNWQN